MCSTKRKKLPSYLVLDTTGDSILEDIDASGFLEPEIVEIEGLESSVSCPRLLIFLMYVKPLNIYH